MLSSPSHFFSFCFSLLMWLFFPEKEVSFFSLPVRRIRWFLTLTPCDLLGYCSSFGALWGGWCICVFLFLIDGKVFQFAPLFSPVLKWPNSGLKFAVIF